MLTAVLLDTSSPLSSVTMGTVFPFFQAHQCIERNVFFEWFCCCFLQTSQDLLAQFPSRRWIFIGRRNQQRYSSWPHLTKFLWVLSSAGPGFKASPYLISSLFRLLSLLRWDSPLTAQLLSRLGTAPAGLARNLEWNLVSHWNPHYNCTLPTPPVKSTCLKHCDDVFN